MAPEPLAARSHHRGHVAPPVEAAKPPVALATSTVPMPQPRPADAPPRTSTKAAQGKDDAKDGANKDGVKEEAAGPPPPSACRLALTDEIAIAPSVPSIHGPGACGGDDLVRLEAVVLPDKSRVALTPTGIMRCTMATAVVNWIRNDVAPEAAKLGSEIKALDNFDSYECRGRNGDPSAHLSEHGKANAIDVHGFKLADGRMIELTDRTQPREFREAVLHSACTRFPTVLGPDSDWHHEDHIHLDLIERRSNYRICQWDVLDPMPKVAPLLPEVRPSDAPPREVAEAVSPSNKKDQGNAKRGTAVGETKSAEPKSTEPKSADAKPAEAKSAEAKSAEAKSAETRSATDRKPDDKPASHAPVATNKDQSAPAKSASPVPPPKAESNKTASKTASADSAEKPKVESKPAPDAGPGSKAVADRATDKAADQNAKPAPSTDKASAEKAATDKASPEKASRKKIVAERPRRHRHRARMWNPFAAFF